MNKSPKSLPTFAFVHGAWHGAWCWDQVRSYLEDQGYKTVAMDLPIEDPAKTIDDDVHAIVDAIKDSEEVVLVGHSRGGAFIPIVANRCPNVRRLVYLCATVPYFDGTEAAFREAPQRNTPNFKAGIVTDTDGLTRFDTARAQHTFYNNCTDAVALAATKRLRRQRKKPVQTEPLTRPNILADYILCSDDNVIYNDWSRYVARTILRVEPYELQGDHSPFLSSSELLAQLLVRIAAQDGRNGN